MPAMEKRSFKNNSSNIKNNAVDKVEKNDDNVGHFALTPLRPPQSLVKKRTQLRGHLTLAFDAFYKSELLLLMVQLLLLLLQLLLLLLLSKLLLLLLLLLLMLLLLCCCCCCCYSCYCCCCC